MTGGTPYPSSVLLPLEGLGHVLSRAETHLSAAMQGSVSRTGEVLLLAFGQEAGSVSELGNAREQALLDMTREQGGRRYREG